jgi:hypothetical protein
VKWTVTKVRIEDECAAVLSKSTIAASKWTAGTYSCTKYSYNYRIYRTTRRCINFQKLTEGGVLSPILFCIYMDELIKWLEKSGIGCHLGNKYVGALAYVNDLTLWAPIRLLK